LAVLPREILTVRGVGDTAYPYWTGSSPDGVHLLLEPGESVLYVARCRVSQISPRAWALPETTSVVVTDRRTGFLTMGFDKGGGWVGFGLGGLAIAATANAVSKRRAAERSAGRVAVGQIRHEWVAEITLRQVKAIIGTVNTYVDLVVATSGGTRVIELWSRGLEAERFARWLVSIVSIHRAGLLAPESAAEISTLQRYQNGGQGPARTGKPEDIGWPFPGQTAELTDSVLARLQPSAREA
jgi:hypothetical protein